ncbi:hypothetical protein OKW21_003435 [Catalinimonas alkaloidigena]|uniref:hypothetical protein n=1 Tax=Catalinimonas alkaloidigena TaxID=1075417 RepID=UPI00240495C0|nr:hypothetical protein [Catalinimonas alkaloidigena]MDF9798172.1 hypothetical protein [Catalinimonas alkaloidigena]
MKRRIIAVAALATFSFASVGAHALPINESDSKIEVVAKIDRKEIKYEDLPEEVKTAFEQSQYKEWEVSKVEEVEVDAETAEAGTQYELTITDGSQSGILAFDEDGNMVQ